MKYEDEVVEHRHCHSGLCLCAWAWHWQQYTMRCRIVKDVIVIDIDVT